MPGRLHCGPLPADRVSQGNNICSNPTSTFATASLTPSQQAEACSTSDYVCLCRAYQAIATYVT